MIDLFRGQTINEKVDIWALGVLLYKLAFFVTPFGETPALGILNCNFSMPEDSRYSESLHNMIRSLLLSDPAMRPTIQQLLKSVHFPRHIAVSEMRSEATDPGARFPGNQITSLPFPNAVPASEVVHATLLIEPELQTSPRTKPSFGDQPTCTSVLLTANVGQLISLPNEKGTEIGWANFDEIPIQTVVCRPPSVHQDLASLTINPVASQANVVSHIPTTQENSIQRPLFSPPTSHENYIPAHLVNLDNLLAK